MPEGSGAAGAQRLVTAALSRQSQKTSFSVDQTDMVSLYCCQYR